MQTGPTRPRRRLSQTGMPAAGAQGFMEYRHTAEQRQPGQFNRGFLSLLIFVLSLLALGLMCLIVLEACTRRSGAMFEAWAAPTGVPTLAVVLPSTATPLAPATREPGTPVLSPTPDEPHALPTLRVEMKEYAVQSGDGLGMIAARYGISLQELADANNLGTDDWLQPGQILVIPAQRPQETGTGNKIIPDSELVYGPAASAFDPVDFTRQRGGYLALYQGDVDGEMLSGGEIVARVARDYSVNPRLLLAVLEYQSGWVSTSVPDERTRDFPVGFSNLYYKGLYKQLAWSANQLNRGYYLWKENGFAAWNLTDGAVVPIDPGINAGTAGVQYLMSLLYGRDGWNRAVSEAGLMAIYQDLFDYPFYFAVEPLLPANLAQPVMLLPFETGVPWSFTSGPHGGWNTGSAWAALDFAPPGEPMGCALSDAWVTAVAPGVITRSDHGAVVQDLDGDGNEHTGWVVFYMHMDSSERVQVGDLLQAGDRIGHPSCEGGFSTGTHLHMARRFNGEWIAADGDLPFNLSGWISSGTWNEYDGFLTKNGQSIEAWDGQAPENQIQR